MTKLDVARIRHYIETKPMQFIEFARAVGIEKQTLYRIFETGSTKRSTVEKMAKVLSLPVESLYEGGPDPKRHKPTTSAQNITYVPVPAQAGFFAGYDGHNDSLLSHFSLPELPSGQFFAFNVTGDSMAPTIKSGDIVVCSKLDSAEEIKPRAVHVIFDRTEGVVVKRLILSGNDLKCISDNKQYQEYIIPAKSVKDIYRVRRVITSNI